MQHDMRDDYLNLGQLDDLMGIVGRRVGKLRLATGAGLGLDRDDLCGGQQGLAMPKVPWLGARSALMARAGGLFRIRRIGGGGTIGGAGVLGQASLERGDPPFLLLDNGEQLQDQLAHDKRGLFPTGGIDRKTRWKWKRSCHRIPFVSRH